MSHHPLCMTLDPADWGAPDNPPHAATLTTTPHPASEVPHG